ncbi:hypothetical protein [Limnohabitans sp. 2KL-1]|uniref:hypothetical protein n=1 Tax=Limnohabitans sp. 2KL-1 TaxID=1100699 RepID=UPI00130488E4|nr:hypothetical protein [Limnohabitans sp. 2KL-1]
MDRAIFSCAAPHGASFSVKTAASKSAKAHTRPVVGLAKLRILFGLPGTERTQHLTD